MRAVVSGATGGRGLRPTRGRSRARIRPVWDRVAQRRESARKRMKVQATEAPESAESGDVDALASLLNKVKISERPASGANQERVLTISNKLLSQNEVLEHGEPSLVMPALRAYVLLEMIPLHLRTQQETENLKRAGAMLGQSLLGIQQAKTRSIPTSETASGPTSETASETASESDPVVRDYLRLRQLADFGCDATRGFLCNEWNTELLEKGFQIDFKASIRDQDLLTLWLFCGGPRPTSAGPGAIKESLCRTMRQNPNADYAIKFCKALKPFLLRSMSGTETPFIIPDRRLPHEEFMRQLAALNLQWKRQDTVKGEGKLESACPVPQTIDSKCDTQKASLPQFQIQQQFLLQYFTPANWAPGMYLIHTPGSGKTCSAIALATSSFLLNDWLVIWVTRPSLRPDIEKNLYGTVCHSVFRTIMNATGKSISPKDNDRKDWKNKFSKNFLDPVSYVQFSNFMNAKWPSLEQLQSGRIAESTTLLGKVCRFQRAQKDPPSRRGDGSVDLGRRVLFIVDEAHRMFARADEGAALPSHEFVKDRELEEIGKRLHESDQVSGQDACKRVLMSGSPMCTHPTQFLKQLNWILPQSTQLPERPEVFDRDWLDSNGFIQGAKAQEFKETAKGLISYVNRTTDAQRFPVVHDVTTIEIPVTLVNPKTATRPDSILGQASFHITRWPAEYRMWSPGFAPQKLRKALETQKLSPIFMQLLANIKQIDEEDQKRHGRLFKHAIFVTAKYPNGAQGPLAVGCCLAAMGWVWTQDRQLRFVKAKLKEKSNYKFCMLTKAPLTGETTAAPEGDRLISSVLGDMRSWCDLREEEKREFKEQGVRPAGGFNDRLTNIRGEMCRFLLIDGHFTEGVDIFDAVHLHMFTTQTSTCSQTQALARVARFCGAAGLPFNVKPQDAQGWPVHVYLYQGYFETPTKGGAVTPYDMVMKVIPRKENIKAINMLFNLIAEVAVDRIWYSFPPLQFGVFGKTNRKIRIGPGPGPASGPGNSEAVGQGANQEPAQERMEGTEEEEVERLGPEEKRFLETLARQHRIPTTAVLALLIEKHPVARGSSSLSEREISKAIIGAIRHEMSKLGIAPSRPLQAPGPARATASEEDEDTEMIDAH